MISSLLVQFYWWPVITTVNSRKGIPKVGTKIRKTNGVVFFINETCFSYILFLNDESLCSGYKVYVSKNNNVMIFSEFVNWTLRIVLENSTKRIEQEVLSFDLLGWTDFSVFFLQQGRSQLSTKNILKSILIGKRVLSWPINK